MSERTTEGATPDRTRLEAFFVRYGDAVSAGDLKAISGCYAFPSIVLSENLDHADIQRASRQWSRVPNVTLAEVSSNLHRADTCSESPGIYHRECHSLPASTDTRSSEGCTPGQAILNCVLHTTQEAGERVDLHEQIDRLDRDQLAELRQYVDDKLNPASSVEERINYRNGWLQSEYRCTDKGTRRGPYWYYKFVKDGQAHSLYIGKSENPKGDIDQILASKAG